MEELLLGSFLSSDKLYVVHQQDIDIAVLLAELNGAIVAYRVDQFIHELFRRHVSQPDALVPFLNQVPDRMHQVCLSKTDAAVQVQGIVRYRRTLPNGERGGPCELIAGPDHERVEGVFRVKPRSRIRCRCRESSLRLFLRLLRLDRNPERKRRPGDFTGRLHQQI